MKRLGNLGLVHGAMVFAAFVLPGAWAQSRGGRIQPVITAITPLALVPGSKTLVRVLGVNLASARQVLFPGTPLAPVPVGERKGAEIPKSLEMKEAGDTQFEFLLELPANLTLESLPIAVQCESARSAPVWLPVRASASQGMENEPNNAFAEANPIKEGIPLLGTIQADKDIDVYVFHPKAGERYEVGLVAGARASLLDGALSVYDAAYRLVASAFNTGSADPVVRFSVSRPEAYYLVVSDAADKGGIWCPYELVLRKLP